MAQSVSDVIVHLVFSTKGRSPWIKSDVEFLERLQIPFEEKYLFEGENR